MLTFSLSKSFNYKLLIQYGHLAKGVSMIPIFVGAGLETQHKATNQLFLPTLIPR